MTEAAFVRDPDIDKLVPPHIESLRPYQPGKPIEETERELGIKNVLKLASNENSLGPSLKAIAAVQKALAGTHLYPDGACFYLKQDLAEALGVEPTEIVVGNGSAEIIEILVRTFLWPAGTRPEGEPDDEAVISDSSFVMYRLALQAHGVKFVSLPLRARTFDLDAMADAVGPSTKMVFVANPNNPTGTWVDKATVERFLDRLPPHVIPVMDEAYFEYVTEPEYPDCLQYRDRHPNLVVLRTFSKIHGLAGFRCGYGIMPERLVSFIERLRSPFNVSSVAQIAARAALTDPGHLEASRRMNAEGLAFLNEKLGAMGLSVTPSVANFILVDFPRDGGEMFQALLRRGIIVRPMGPFGFPNSVRITVGTREENERLVEVLRDVLSS